MTRRPLAVSLALLACALLGVALARPAAAQSRPAELPPLYEVEVLIFAHTELDPTEEDFSRRTASEQRVVAPAVPRVPGQVELEPLEPEPADATLEAEPARPPAAAEPAPPPAAEPAPPSGPVDPREELRVVRDYRTGRLVRFRPLEPAELELTRHYRTLERLGAYRPLLHVGWLQEALSEAEAQPIDLSLFGAVNPVGSIRLHLSRFLHLTLDLAYQGQGSAAGVPGAAALGEIAVPPRYTLATQRRIRNGALNYFDHPAFGVLVMVRFVDPPPTTTPPDRPLP